MVNEFSRYDEAPDEEFYRAPRFVAHIDDGAIAAVTQLYREFFPAGGTVLDLMTSHLSHLPPDVTYARVGGLGMNRAELERNPHLSSFEVQNLNRNGVLPFADASFDAAGCCVSIDYLTQPVTILREVGRVLKPGGPFVITFSNRCFPSKAVKGWLESDDFEHIQMVEGWLEQAGNWREVRSLNRSPARGDPLYAVIGFAAGAFQNPAPDSHTQEK